MSYSLKNKAVALIALALAVMIVPNTVWAEGTPTEAPLPTPISEDVDIFGLDDEEENIASTTDAKENLAEKTIVSVVDANGNEIGKVDSGANVTDFNGNVIAHIDENGNAIDQNGNIIGKTNDVAQKSALNGSDEESGENKSDTADQNQPASDDVDDFLNDVDENNDIATEKNTNQANTATPPVADDEMSDDSDLLNDTSSSDKPNEQAEAPVSVEKDEVIPVTEAPKSPFESFGNAILAKVDSDLFNQMSNIEKQTTLLNLELKREELKNKVEALKAARKRAKEEEDERRRAIEEKRKDREAERQAKIIAAQERLRQREIELEKVRQARVLNAYMNEMLLINQQWVEKNASLQSRIIELEKERIDLIKDFEDKTANVYREIFAVKKRAESAVATHERVVTSLNAQITQLRRSVIENEDRYKKLKDGNAANPFAASPGLNGIDEDAIDMSKEYAIMDITGKGENIVAKIVNSEGTTFIVHKGSMLKGGEVVTAITDNYIAFDNKGIKSYLYTGGSVMEFEPTVSFNDSEKMPEETEKMSIKSDVHNVLGQKEKQSAAQAQNTPKPVAVRKVATPSKPNTGRSSVSASSGMFVQ